ncbi:MAG: twin-arginine translocase TatA/TatE family subunit [Cryobacterium sp.]|nr:twin-arginine translocase TatA/TatE family subunit [Oligoflexia bacterium]
MFGLSGEHVVILLIILLIFGPRKLPELGNTLGKAIRNFKDSINGVQDAKYRNLDDQSDRAQVVSETKTPVNEEKKPVPVVASPGIDDPTKKST